MRNKLDRSPDYSIGHDREPSYPLEAPLSSGTPSHICAEASAFPCGKENYTATLGNRPTLLDPEIP